MVIVRNNNNMFKAFGVVVILWYLSHLFSASFVALDAAATATFNTVETAAEVSEATIAELAIQ